ncbi:isochorismate synthase [Patiriisocius marinus]|uniref:isochorismate synthase n=1 Tax=Patiriisocius marinus TaxID=1397112 RepID=A0A5J4IWP7_9FLAO|nr:isochorismate synthase [Patiriisocius marinus]GER59326.1 hypothetical protein ULMA_14340 [Patiriisocius marinus]
MDKPTVLNKLNEQWEKKLPFVLFSMPNTTKCSLYFQDNTSLHTTENFLEPGFVFSPFHNAKESLIIPSTVESTLEFDFAISDIEHTQTPIISCAEEKKEHVQLVNTILKKIKNQTVEKVVASRKKDIPLTKLVITELAMRLLQLYPKAFRYIWYHPDTGLWCGASPEILIKREGNMFSTMALAGTKKNINGQVVKWSYKEMHEQQLVTEALVTNLQKIVSVLKTSKPVTVEAGSLSHLKTEIQGVIKSGKTALPKIIFAIHPTPAVCGTPTKEAKNIILEFEKYDREFYTGFLGPISPIEGTATIFVNLRCAKIENETASIYVGGGIVYGSIAEDEWTETENKLATMLKVLSPFM